MYPEVNTSLNTIAIGFTALMCVLVLVLPRRYAFAPVVMMACYMTGGQVSMVAGLHFSMLRILVLFGILRIIVRGELQGLRLNPIDKAVLWWIATSVAIYALLWGSLDAFVYKSGQAYDALGLYFLFRCAIREVQDAVRMSNIVAFLLVPLAGSMAIEKMTGGNAFAVFGGVPLITDIRDGVLRCQGPFLHPILAGTFGAVWVPLFVGLGWQKNSKKVVAAMGIAAATIITLTSGSSGPVMTYLAGLVGCLMWPFRRRMRQIRWGIVFSLLVLQLFMKTPVWFLLAHVGVFSASTAYYRAFLIDQTIMHFSEWWLVGTKYLHPWALLLTDITDMYVRVAMDGGLLALILFFLIIKRCFAGVGWAVWGHEEQSKDAQHILWVLGAALFAHTMTFLGVWYWDFNIVNWYLVLAVISSLTGSFFPGYRPLPAMNAGFLAPLAGNVIQKQANLNRPPQIPSKSY